MESNVKVTEKLFDANNKNYDTKHKLNLSKIQISSNFVSEIESNGITSEQLDNNNLPVCRYLTQITVHGLFPESVNKIYGVNGYKNIIQNKNKSLGIKYNAVDYKKKKALYNAIAFKDNSYHINFDSTSFYIEKYIRILSDNANEIKKFVTECTQIKNRVHTNLFYGYLDLCVMQGLWCKYIVFRLNINAIYLKNMQALFEQFVGTKESYLTVLKEKEKKDNEKNLILKKQYEKEEKELQVKREKEKKEFLAKLPELEKKLIDNGYKKVTNYDYEMNVFIYFVQIRESELHKMILKKTKNRTCFYTKKMFEDKFHGHETTRFNEITGYYKIANNINQ